MVYKYNIFINNLVDKHKKINFQNFVTFSIFFVFSCIFYFYFFFFFVEENKLTMYVYCIVVLGITSLAFLFNIIKRKYFILFLYVKALWLN